MSKKIMVDGNAAAAMVAHACSEICAIYPITPSSPMGELADEFSAAGKKNLWGTVPEIVEMQSEGGAAGALHGAMTTGAMTSTFTASQGLLLMLPNMYKIAGELTSTVFHVSARSLACQALSIFGDHSDVMACRQTGFALLASAGTQEIMDLASISHAATLASRVPFLHFFDGFRSSHELQKIEEVDFSILERMIDDDMVKANRSRGLTPDNPRLRGTAQNPDVYFQGRETVNRFYSELPAMVQQQMDRFAAITGRSYHLFDYVGHPQADHVIVIMGSGADTVHETVEQMVDSGAKVGVIKVRLYRPFATKEFAAALPAGVKTISVLDRTKEPGAIGEPLYLDVRTALGEAMQEKWIKRPDYPVTLGGRYGLGSKEFTPAMVKAVFDNATCASPKNHFTVGINDDVSHTSLDYDPSFQLAHPGRVECMFYGLGSDGTVGANKNSITIIGEDTDNYAQGFFVYDSKKAGAITVSHLRFGPEEIRSPYLCSQADFIACHNFSFVEKYDMLANAREGGVFLLASPYDADAVWSKLPDEIAAHIIDKKLKFYVIDAVSLANKLGLGSHINTLMQTCFFAISGILPQAEAIESLKNAIRKTYGRKGEKVVEMNFAAVDAAVSALQEVKVPDQPAGKVKFLPPVAQDAPEFVRNVTAVIMQQKGDSLPVSAIPEDGTWPTDTARYEKRNIAIQIPEWEPDVCIQCAQCSFVCPHAAIRVKAYKPEYLEKAPDSFKSADAKGKEFTGMKFTVQVAPEDCTGCGACVARCPAKERDKESRQPTGRKAINMADQIPLRHPEAENFDFFLNHIPETDPGLFDSSTVKGSQFLRPLFEFSGACAGCGETAYLKLLSQLFGDRLFIANATGCSSIYGGNLPTTPYGRNADGRGPTWSNSLFEDNAEFGMGMRLTVDKFSQYARELLDRLLAGQSDCPGTIPRALLEALRDNQDTSAAGVIKQRQLIAELRKSLAGCTCRECRQLTGVADYLAAKSVWVVGGDGWAYDIGFGGLDHVLASGRNINVLVLDTEVYSNTGGQASKATPMGAVAKFAASGKPRMKKDLGMIAMTYGNIYVAQVAVGSNPAQTVKALTEAEAYDGPSLVIAYSHCIAHGIEMVEGYEHQKMAVASGHFPLYRYNPEAGDGRPLVIDSKKPSITLRDYVMQENRYRVLEKIAPEASRALLDTAGEKVKERFNRLEQMAAMTVPGKD